MDPLIRAWALLHAIIKSIWMRPTCCYRGVQLSTYYTVGGPEVEIISRGFINATPVAFGNFLMGQIIPRPSIHDSVH